MKYMLLIYDNEQEWATMPAETRNAMFGEYMTFTREIRASGNFIDGAPLKATSTATSIQVRDNANLVTDGPFAETREQLGGYYLVEAKDLDEAISIAARIPSARIGTIEIRPVEEM